MKKYSRLGNSRSAFLKPLDSCKQPVTFRNLVKFRNQANGIVAMPCPPKDQNATTMRKSCHARSNTAERISQPNSPIKAFVKDPVKKNAINPSSLTLRSPPASEESEVFNQFRCNQYTRMEGSLLEGKTRKESKASYSLEDLRKKVDHLLELNLQRCRLMQGNGEVTSWVDSKKAQEVEAQLYQIQESLKNPKEEEQELAEIVSKIDLIEHVLSGNAGESYSMKRNYYNQRNNYFNTTSHQSKHMLGQSYKFNTKYDMSFVAKSKPKPYLQICTSSSKEFYNKPKREFYVPPVKNVKKYEPNREPIQESSYSMQFQPNQMGLVFPSQEPIRRPLPETSLCVKNSTYQNQFGNKSSSMMPFDLRDQDCTRNKLKNIEISFMEASQKRDNKQILKQSKRKVDKQNYSPHRSFDYKAGLFTLNEPIQSEHQHQFTKADKIAEEKLQSSPKNKNLLKLKDNFRYLVHQN